MFTCVLDHATHEVLADLLEQLFEKLLASWPLTKQWGHPGQHGVQPLLLDRRYRAGLHGSLQERVGLHDEKN